DFWVYCNDLRSNCNEPCLFVGNFNTILSSNEKIGGGPPQYGSMHAFKDFIDSNILIDMGCKGDPFTWSNMQEWSKKIKERLDRALCNSNWNSTLDITSVTHELPIGSNHSSILVDLIPQPNQFLLLADGGPPSAEMDNGRR
ncbi:hypothetical protein LINPERPRIM_LOCUS38307, partial [Linum perenne]